MAETMVEKVARAMCAAAEDDWDWSVFYIVDANDTAETGRDVYRDMARAAIELIRDGLTPEFATIVMDASRYIDWSKDQSDEEEWYGNYHNFKSGWETAFSGSLKE